MGVFFAVVLLIVFVVVALTAKKKPSPEEAAKKQMQEIARVVAGNFERVGWPSWSYSVHLLHDQIQRMHRADISTKMELLRYSSEYHTAIVKGDSGEEYYIDESGCSCPDFRVRGLPCKHMYFAVAELTGSDE